MNANLTEDPAVVAERVVNRLLDEYSPGGYDDADEERAGRKKDPWRKTTSPIKFSSKDFTGKRPAGSKEKECDPDKDENCPPKHKNRFNVKFEDRTPIASAPGKITTKKAGGKTDDHETAKSAMKGKSGSPGKKGSIASPPGKVKHEAIALAIYGKQFENLTLIQQERVQEAVFNSTPARRLNEADSAKVRCDSCHWADGKHAPWCTDKDSEESEGRSEDKEGDTEPGEKAEKGINTEGLSLGGDARSLLDEVTRRHR